jgi:hypothetical protein
MVRSIMSPWTLATLISICAVTASAQPRGQGNRAGGQSPNEPSFLLASESVQKELALGDAQKEKLEKIWDDEQNGAREFFRGFIGMSQEQIQKKIDARARATRKRIAKILSPEQMQRLDEINLQVVGNAALTYEAVAAKLQLTPEQQVELQKVGDDSRQELAALYATANGQPPTAEGQAERNQKQKMIVTELNDQLIAVLTEEQHAAFEKMKGEAFDTSTIQPRRRSFTNRGRINSPPAPVQ